MTSFCILAQLQNSATGSDTADISILNIDRDRAAFTLSSELSNHLNYSKAEMNFSCDDAETAEDSLADCDVVYLAALVGSTAKEKRGIVRSIAKRMREGALLVVRSAWGLRTLLYPVSQLDAHTLSL
jgi:nicotianamine synthase